MNKILACCIFIALILITLLGCDKSQSPSRISPVSSTPTMSPTTPIITLNTSGSWTIFRNLKNISLCASKGNDLWGVTSDGIIKWDFEKDLYQKFTIQDGLISIKISSIVFDNQGNLWVGSLDKGLSYYDGQKWLTFSNEQNIGYEVHTIFKDKDGKMWVGTEKGISCFDGQNWQTWGPLSDQNKNGITMARVIFGIAQDIKGHIWYISSNSKMGYLDGTIWRPEQIQQAVQIHGIAADDRGYVWISTSNGAYRFNWSVDPLDKEWKIFTSQDGLAYDIVNYIFRDIKGNLWFATDKGVTCYDGTTWKTYTPIDESNRNYFYYSTQDDLGNIWFCAGGIVCRFNSEK